LRILNCEAASEKAAHLLVEAVGVVGDIVRDPATPVRTRVRGQDAPSTPSAKPFDFASSAQAASRGIDFF
jgi:hypothetical protein